MERQYGKIREKYIRNAAGELICTGYEGRITLGKNMAGKQNQKSFYDRTIDGVKKQMDEFASRTFTATEKVAYHLKVKDWTTYWFEKLKKPCLKEGSIRILLRQITLINDAIGDMFLQKVMEYNLQIVINMRVETGVKASTTRKLKMVIEECFDCAYRYGLIASNITEGLKSPRTQQAERIPLSKAEDEILKSAIKGNEYEEFITALRGSAARKNEGLGICWNDVDFDNNLICIGNQLKVRQRKSGKIFSVEKDTKNGVFAPIYVPEYVINAIKSMKKKQEHWKETNPKYNNYLNLVFTDENGNPLDPNKISDYVFTLKEKLNRKDFCLHILRHTRASEVYYETKDPLVVQALLRHRYLSSTYTYLHIIPGSESSVLGAKEQYRNEVIKPIKEQALNCKPRYSILN